MSENGMQTETIEQLSRERDSYRKALEAICKHMEYSVPNGYQLSAVWAIANKALRNNGGK